MTDKLSPFEAAFYSAILATGIVGIPLICIALGKDLPIGACTVAAGLVTGAGVYASRITSAPSGPAMQPPAAPKIGPKVGDVMEDDTIFAGMSPDTSRPMYAMPRDAPLSYTFDQARRRSAKSDEYGHDDWRVPTKGELNVLFENRNKGRLKGTFNETGLVLEGLYWSSSPLYWSPSPYCEANGAWAQCFSDGSQYTRTKVTPSSLRCVR